MPQSLILVLKIERKSMARHVRYYVFGEDGLRHLSHRVMKAIYGGDAPIPEFAGTMQKAVEVVVESVDGKPHQIIRVLGFYLPFDEQGHLTETRGPKEKWTLSDADMQLVSAKFGGGAARDAKPQPVDRPAVLPPAENAVARECLDEVSDLVRRIYLRMTNLSEAELNALSIHARTTSKDVFDDPIMFGVSVSAERRCGSLMRVRTGYGTWFAAVEATEWDEEHRHAIDSTILAWEKCSTRDEAEVAARRLLAENAKHFSHRLSLETNIYSEVDWPMVSEAIEA
jgi:hypothetical protein